MNQFTDKTQIQYYDTTRPKYNDEVFTQIIKDTNSFDYYLDIACGCGQLLKPISKHFKQSFGIDISEEQINASKNNLNGSNNVSVYVSDAYNVLSVLEEQGFELKNKFSLITIGQAFHWFDEDKLLTYIKDNLLAENGVLIIAGYYVQHFEPEHFLYEKFNIFMEILRPYFECDVRHVDTALVKSKSNFEKYFKHLEWNYFTEKTKITKDKLIGFLKSWSGYTNYRKLHSDDPLDMFYNIEFDEDSIDYFVKYFVISFKN